jgi:hypothetical protein
VKHVVEGEVAEVQHGLDLTVPDQEICSVGKEELLFNRRSHIGVSVDQRVPR